MDIMYECVFSLSVVFLFVVILKPDSILIDTNPYCLVTGKTPSPALQNEVIGSGHDISHNVVHMYKA